MGPVRVGNQAAEQLQHDAYGSIILGASQMFIDERLPRMGDEALFRRLEPLGEQARTLRHGAGRRDSGSIAAASACIRIRPRCAGSACDRLGASPRCWDSRTAPPIGAGRPTSCAKSILERAWSERRGAIVGALEHDELDASVLLLPELGLLPANDPRFVETCEVIGKELNRNGFIMRYTADDDFGAPETAFLVCQFWYIDALAAIGRQGTRRASCSTDLLAQRNSFGMLSEDIASRHRRAVGQSAADLFDGRHHQHRHELVAPMGKAGQA